MCPAICLVLRWVMWVLILGFVCVGGGLFEFSSEEFLFSAIVTSTLMANTPRTMFTCIKRMRTISRAKAVGNGVISSCKRPIVNTGIGIGNAAGNAVASVSKGFALGGMSNNALIVSFVNCGALRISMGKAGLTGVVVRRSARILSRIIIMNCNARGGRSLANSMAIISRGLFGSGNAIPGPLSTVRNRIPNLHVAQSSTTPNRRK